MLVTLDGVFPQHSIINATFEVDDALGDRVIPALLGEAAVATLAPVSHEGGGRWSLEVDILLGSPSFLLTITILEHQMVGFPTGTFSRTLIFTSELRPQDVLLPVCIGTGLVLVLT